MTSRAARTLAALLLLLLSSACAIPPAPGSATAVPVAGPVWGSAQTVGREIVVTLQRDWPEGIPALAQALARQDGLMRVADWPLAVLGVHCLVFRADTAAAAADLRTRLERDPRVEQVQQMNSFTLLDGGGADPLADLQQGLDQANARRAHPLATGRGVRIGVIDTGIDAGHPDLRDRMAVVQDFVSLPADGAPRPAPERHGTAMAGIMAAERGNGHGIVGIAPEARLLGLRACWEQPGGADRGNCNSFTLARAVHYAVVNRPDVLNLSLQGFDDPLLARLLTRAMADGITVVAAYDARRPGHFPASLPGVIAVAEAGAAGPSPPPGLLRAPGVDILSTLPGAGYGFVSGSSIAAAHVAGAAALLLQHAPRLEPAQVATLLRATAVLPASGLDACRAVAGLLAERPGQRPAPSACGPE